MTRGPRQSSGTESVTPFRVVADSQALAASVGAVFPDPVYGRLARLRRSVGFTARAFAAEGACDVVMVTLTYKCASQWHPRQVSGYLKATREWLRRRGVVCRYVWVAELQRRGAPHYHVCFFLPVGVRIPMPDRAGLWPWGSTRVELARAAVPYLMKYLSKGSDALPLPGGARSHGRGGCAEWVRASLRWLSAPAFVRARGGIGSDWRRAVGGGWCSALHGVWLPSEWVRTFVGRVWALVRVFDHGRPFEADGPYCEVSYA